VKSDLHSLEQSGAFRLAPTLGERVFSHFPLRENAVSWTRAATTVFFDNHYKNH
jgi:hypothetical protein